MPSYEDYRLAAQALGAAGLSSSSLDPDARLWPYLPAITVSDFQHPRFTSLFTLDIPTLSRLTCGHQNNGPSTAIKKILDSQKPIPVLPLSYFGTQEIELGKGGYGTVVRYRSRDADLLRSRGLEPHDTYVVKFARFDPMQTEVILPDQLRELAVGYYLTHTNIQRPVALGSYVEDATGRQRYALVFEEAQYNLRQFLTQQRTQEENELALVSLGVALYAAHNRNIVHADVTPDNVLVYTGNGLNFKLADFGFASSYCQEKTTGKATRLNYRAPEILAGEAYDDMADMWSLGCMVYEIHTGQPLFNGRTSQEYFAEILQLLGDPLMDPTLRDLPIIRLIEGNEVYQQYRGLPRNLARLNLEPVLFLIMDQLLQYRPGNRISAGEFLQLLFPSFAESCPLTCREKMLYNQVGYMTVFDPAAIRMVLSERDNWEIVNPKVVFLALYYLSRFSEGEVSIPQGSELAALMLAYDVLDKGTFAPSLLTNVRADQVISGLYQRILFALKGDLLPSTAYDFLQNMSASARISDSYDKPSRTSGSYDVRLLYLLVAAGVHGAYTASEIVLLLSKRTEKDAALLSDLLPSVPLYIWEQLNLNREEVIYYLTRPSH